MRRLIDRPLRDLRSAGSLFHQGTLTDALTLGQLVELTVGTTHGLVLGGDRLGTYDKAVAANPIVHAAFVQRLQLLSEIRFRYRRIRDGRPSEFFGHESLRLLERPQPGAGTALIPAMFELDDTLYGNAYAWRVEKDYLEFPHPLTVSKIHVEVRETTLDGSKGKLRYRQHLGWSIETEPGKDPVVMGAEEVAHYWTRPDPARRGMGMSWLGAAWSEVLNDEARVQFAAHMYRNAATPNMVITSERPLSESQQEQLRELADQRYAGPENAFRTMIVSGGGDVKVVGQNFREITFRETQDAGENRIGMASGVPAPIIGVQLGTNPTYNNFNTARRHFADSFGRPAWRNMAQALEVIIGKDAPVDVRSGAAQLWYDPRDVAALQQDESDEAEIRGKDAATIRQLVDAGFDPDTVVQAVDGNDLTLLEHSGLMSVQLLPPGTAQPGSTEEGSE